MSSKVIRLSKTNTNPSIWEDIAKPDQKFYLPIEKSEIFKLYMEKADEVWLKGIIYAFIKKEDLVKYLRRIAEDNEAEIKNYDIWTATLKEICGIIPSITEKNRGVRVSLYKVDSQNYLEYVDVLWDNSTT